MSVKAVTNGGKMRITEVNPHLICALCGGYLIDATTIVECLHSFCKTCIMRYLETSKYCPICEVLIHKTRPWQNIRLDETLQNIVYKLVPDLFQREMKRRREYYDNQPVPSKSSGKARTSNRIIFSADEEFSVSLEFWPEGPNSTETDCQNKVCDKLHDRRYLLCPAAVNMSHLKRFIRNKFSLSDRYQIDIYHTNQPLSDHFTLIDVAYIYSWRREGILRLFYAFYLNEAKKMKVDDEKEKKPEVEEIKQEPEPVNVCKDVIFENNISIIESEKKPALVTRPNLPNREDNQQYQPPTPVTQDVATDLSRPFVRNSDIPPKSTLITNNHEATTQNDDVVIFDDDDEDERQMQIVMEEVEIEDSESNLEIVIDDEPEAITSTVPAPRLDSSPQPPSDSKTEVLSVPSVKLQLTKQINNNVNEKSSISDKTSNLQTKPKPNHFEAVQKYVKSQLPPSPSKDAQSQTVATPKESLFKEPSPHISKDIVKDTASQVVMSRPSPSPVKETTFRYPTAKPDKKDVTMKHVVASPKSPTRLLITSKEIFSKSSNSSQKETSSNHHSSSKKDGVHRSSNDKNNLVATKSTKKDSPHRLILSIHKDTSGKSTSNSKDTPKQNTSQSYVASYTMKSSTKETFSRPLTSSKKETASHPPSSPNKIITPSIKVPSSPNKITTLTNKVPSSPTKVSSSQAPIKVMSSQIKVPQSPTHVSPSTIKVMSSPKIPSSPSKLTSSSNKVPTTQNKVASSPTRIPTSPIKTSPSSNRTSPPNKMSSSVAPTPTINRVPTPTPLSTNLGKDLTTKISNNTIKDTAAQIGKQNHKDSNSHSHTAKSLTKDSHIPNVSAHIKHVPQVPRLVKTPITQLKPQSSEAYRHLPHNIIPKWQPHLNNGYYKPPQETPLELKREAVPIDYSKPS